MKFLNFDKILVLAPHPDDAEYSISGTILKYKDTHFDILCLTDGGDCDITTVKNERQSEIINSWNVSNPPNITLFFTPNVYLKEKSEEEWIQYIETIHDISSYNCILSPSELDSHFEHRIISGFTSPIVRSHSCGIIQYKSPSTLDFWTPNLFVSIDSQYELKMQMLLEFKSQLHRPYFKRKVLDGFHTHFQCMKKGMNFIESYKILTAYE